VHQLEIKVLDIVDARCNREVEKRGNFIVSQCILIH